MRIGTCGTIGFRNAGGNEVRMLGFVGTQASHKGTGTIEIGFKVVLARFSCPAEESKELLSGSGRFFWEDCTDMSVRVRILLCAGGVVFTEGAPGPGGCGPGNSVGGEVLSEACFFSNMRKRRRAIVVIQSSHFRMCGLRPIEYP